MRKKKRSIFVVVVENDKAVRRQEGGRRAGGRGNKTWVKMMLHDERSRRHKNEQMLMFRFDG